MLCFCVVDMQLYLDTHPEDEEAFCYFKEVVEMYEKAKKKTVGTVLALAVVGGISLITNAILSIVF